jgi:hypothetical protein
MGKNYTKTKNKTKNKTKKQKLVIHNRTEARKYIELMNIALKHMHSDISVNLFDKEDYHLLSYLKTGIKKGYKILKDKNIIKETECHMLCMTVSILNDSIGSKTFEKLNDVEKLYLFFISYLVTDVNIPKQQADLVHAIKKLDMIIKRQRLRYDRYKIEKGETHKETRRSLATIDKYIESKRKLISSSTLDDKLKYLFNLDVCDTIDCMFLQKYKMNKGVKFDKSYSKLCQNIPEIFKGIIWLNMCIILTRNKSIYNISIMNLPKIEPKIDIRRAVYKNDILIIPMQQMYISKLTYAEGESILDSGESILDSGELWVYRAQGLTIEKVLVKSLERKHYVVAMLYLPTDYTLSKDKVEEQRNNLFNNFVEGVGPKPVLTTIYKSDRNNRKTGLKERDICETIDNSITQHWLYMHQSRLDTFIKENIFS